MAEAPTIFNEPQEVLEPEEYAAKERPEQDDPELLQRLLTMIEESRQGREGGDFPRDQIWRENWDAYWGRFDWSHKAPWQSKQHLPECSNFVERFVASLRTAFTQTGSAAFTVDDPLDPGNALTDDVKRFTWALLDRSGTGPAGHVLSFTSTFGEALKNGCMAQVALAVSWRRNRVVVDCVDPFEVYLDPTRRGRYRVRRFERDRDQLLELRDEVDSEGESIWNVEAIEMLASGRDEEGKVDKERATGSTQEITHNEREAVLLHEILYEDYDEDGRYRGKTLAVVGNQRVVIRGPEENPFMHGEDWNITAPLIRVPQSVYGRSYMESFASLANTFIEFTNLLLDATHTSAMRAFVAWPSAMEDPTQLDEGIHPNKLFIADDDNEQVGKAFIQAIELGSLPADAVTVWRQLRSMLNESASQSEVALGQLAPKSDTTATEIQASQTSQSALINSIAADIEDVIDILLRIVYYTGIQHYDPETDADLAAELGPELSAMIVAQREELLTRKFKFRFRGITGAIERARRMRGLLGFLNIVGGNEILAKAFLQKYSLSKLVDELLRDFGIDPARIEKDEQERMMEMLEKVQAVGGAPGTAPGSGEGVERGGAALAESDPGASLANVQAPI